MGEFQAQRDKRTEPVSCGMKNPKSKAQCNYWSVTKTLVFSYAIRNLNGYLATIAVSGTLIREKAEPGKICDPSGLFKLCPIVDRMDKFDTCSFI